MQISDGKKATELEIVQAKALCTISFKVTKTMSVIDAAKAKADNTRNLLVRSVAYNIIQ